MSNKPVSACSISLGVVVGIIRILVIILHNIQLILSIPPTKHDGHNFW